MMQPDALKAQKLVLIIEIVEIVKHFRLNVFDLISLKSNDVEDADEKRFVCHLAR